MPIPILILNLSRIAIMASLVRLALRFSLPFSRGIAMPSPVAVTSIARRPFTTKPLQHTARRIPTHTVNVARPTSGHFPFLPARPFGLRHASTTAPSVSSTSPASSVSTAPAAKPAGKLRDLVRQYGPTGVGVYFAISAVDFGITFLAIQAAGADKVRRMEDWMFERFGNWGVFGIKEREQNLDRGDGPSAATVLVLAYGIHKTLLLPFRLGATAAVTPWVVRRLRAMGWSVGGRKTVKV
ncbi:hypothetical protein BC938DRAFT_479297 [Jimgerdemannia flammicorona]|uniref:DUF1279 domain-containing protein n=1 Tax=Jimgerdemannia flammicorona TaxID=994334 RepID=A0A433QL62_9FUNG|nr:hypothetical protein BC938DRAFT_479297 [Jimgerdemannia flammicorona]